MQFVHGTKWKSSGFGVKYIAGHNASILPTIPLSHSMFSLAADLDTNVQ